MTIDEYNKLLLILTIQIDLKMWLKTGEQKLYIN